VSGIDDVWGGLHTGAPITVHPVHSRHTVRGHLVDEPCGGPAAAARARVTPAAALSASGEPVWVTARSAGDGTLVVLRAVAREVPRRRGEVEFSDVRRIADESRRAALRAATECPALLVLPGRTSRGTRTLDLSSHGCRVGLPHGPAFGVGQALQIAMDVDNGATVWADGVVVWLDLDRGEAAMRFTRVTDADAERLDRRVLAALSGRPS
jgi:hypothetical protein